MERRQALFGFKGIFRKTAVNSSYPMYIRGWKGIFDSFVVADGIHQVNPGTSGRKSEITGNPSSVIMKISSRFTVNHIMHNESQLIRKQSRGLHGGWITGMYIFNITEGKGRNHHRIFRTSVACSKSQQEPLIPRCSFTPVSLWSQQKQKSYQLSVSQQTIINTRYRITTPGSGSQG